MKTSLLITGLFLAAALSSSAYVPPASGTASWYGKAHRGKLMANGRRFDTNKLTAASWFYPLGSKIRVHLEGQPSRAVLVTITDRGPAKELVRGGRIIDLAEAAFKQLAPPQVGLVQIKLERVR